MLSTLRGITSPGLRRAGCPSRPAASRCWTGDRPLAALATPRRGLQLQLRPPVSGRYALRKGSLARQAPAEARLCSGGSGTQRKPPTGFEKFAEGSEGAASSTGAKGSTKGTPPKEGARPAESSESGGKPKEEPQSEPSKDGKPNEGKAKEDSSKDGKSGEGGKEKDGDSFLNMDPEQRRITISFMVGAALCLAYAYFVPSDPEEEITIQELLREHLVKGHVEKIQIINKSVGRVQLRNDAPSSLAGKELTIRLGTPEQFEAKLEHLQAEMGISPLEFVPIQYVSRTNWMDELWPSLPALLMLGFLAYRGMGSGVGSGLGGPGVGGMGGRNIFNIGKAFPKGQKDLKSKVKFTDVAGLEQAKAEVVEFVDFLKSPDKYRALGARIPKGGLLVGPPGTGKTLLAKAVAGEADCPFFSMSGSDFIEMFVGVGPSRVRDLFQQARSQAPSIIFIDEIDAIGRKRGRGNRAGGNDERENTLNQLLVEMDGFSASTNIVVLGGTNRLDILDNALTRPGRFDRQIAIDKPDMKERQQIYQVHLKPIKLAESLSPDSIAQRMAALTPGFAGADIANVCNEAAIYAARRNAPGVEMKDFELATERVIGGLAKENSLMSEKERRTIALHESGHALAGWFLRHSDPLLKVSIVPRSSGALGFAQYLPEELSMHSEDAILDKIAVALGGRAAEELFVGEISTGAANDLEKVTKMAYSMVSVFGMNPKLGLVSYSQNNASEQFYRPYSEATGQIIDAEAKQIIDSQYKRVKELLTEKKDLLHQMADELMKEDTLVYNQLVAILGERPHGIKEEFRSFVTADGNPFAVGGEEDAKVEQDDSGKGRQDGENASPPPSDAGATTLGQTASA